MKNEKDSQARKYQITINNAGEHGLNHDTIKAALTGLKSTRYFCIADEVGEQGTPHTHIFVAFSAPVRFSTLQRAFKGKAHIESCQGTSEENRAYVQKSGKWATSDKAETSVPGSFEEWGELPDERPGRRSDLATLYEQIKAGASDYEILESNPKTYMLYSGAIAKARQVVENATAASEYRDVKVFYIYGPPGTGKTRSVVERYGDTLYRVTDYKNPWDAYAGQQVVCFDNYSGDLPLRSFLTYTEGYKTQLPKRYVNAWANFNTVIVSTNVAPDELYKDDRYNNPGLWRAYLKRLDTIVYFTEDGQQVQHEVTDDLLVVPVDEVPLDGFGGFGNPSITPPLVGDTAIEGGDGLSG